MKGNINYKISIKSVPTYLESMNKSVFHCKLKCKIQNRLQENTKTLQQEKKNNRGCLPQYECYQFMFTLLFWSGFLVTSFGRQKIISYMRRQDRFLDFWCQSGQTWILWTFGEWVNKEKILSLLLSLSISFFFSSALPAFNEINTQMYR